MALILLFKLTQLSKNKKRQSVGSTSACLSKEITAQMYSAKAELGKIFRHSFFRIQVIKYRCTLLLYSDIHYTVTSQISVLKQFLL